MSEFFKVLCHFCADSFHGLHLVVVIGVGDLVQELDAALLHLFYSGDDVLSAERNVLDACPAVIFAKLLYLRLPNAIGRLVDTQHDLFIEISDHGCPKRRILRIYLFVID